VCRDAFSSTGLAICLKERLKRPRFDPPSDGKPAKIAFKLTLSPLE